MLKSAISEVLESQQERNSHLGRGIERDIAGQISLKGSHINIISGIRRCGKSTLLRQLFPKDEPFLFLNFEDPKLSGFALDDFNKLDEIIKEKRVKKIYFDEIQVIPEWERYIRALHDEKYQVFITGSNASMLSRELGTKLTGRHLIREIFPFSYKEFLTFTGGKASTASSRDYFNKGGFPEYLKDTDQEILHQILYDIIYRDIAVRQQVRRHETLKQMLLYIISNISKVLSYNQLKNTFELGSATTVIDYLSYFQDSYLLFTIPRFDYSLKKQIFNPRKIYSIDTGLANANSLSFSKDEGRILENAVFLHYRRKGAQVFYYTNRYECDFIIKEEGVINHCLQVCSSLKSDNLTRETNGIIEAMEYCGVKKGLIVTTDQEDELKVKEHIINVIPYWKLAISDKETT
ncbi:MAG: ATP-binding protein [Bacteroidetes bacterium]|nr:ATP-binding protein [Bacteroidota bacterium]